MARPANKARVNLTVETHVLEAARALGLNISHAAEDGLKRAIQETQAERWKRENADALMAHNARIERTGTLLSPEWAAGLSGKD
ncbi:hypothetical protein FLX56_09300 [Synechococcus moorigangaii CMS01]|jgi:antitoxin CcdA|nr:hypothetical protein [Synechococcus moorigangaii CMS01]